MGHIRRWRSRREADTPRGANRGQALVELALVTTLIAFTGFMALDMGRAFHAMSAAHHAARDGTRVGSDPESTDAQIRAAVTNAAKPYTPATVISPSRPIAATATDVTVKVTLQFEPVTPMLDQLWGGRPYSLTRSFTGRMEEV